MSERRPDATRAQAWRRTPSVLLLAGLAGCWPGPLTRVGGDAGGPDLRGAASFVALAPCLTENSYATGNSIQFGGAIGQNYQPECLSVHVGDAVSFAGDFGTHPLRASTRGDAGSAIVDTQTGTSASFVFPSEGYFPYYCGRHGQNGGGGMSGVIRVLP